MNEFDYINCDCGWVIKVPQYVNVGRSLPMPIFCDKCGAIYKYWTFFGCQTKEDTKTWMPHKGRPNVEKE